MILMIYRCVHTQDSTGSKVGPINKINFLSSE